MTRVQKFGGLVQGLYLNGELVGFTYAILAKWQEEYFIYSHMTGVRKEDQKKGFGFLLKKAQRQEVLNMGYDVIRWNFDPLESMNAFFNIQYFCKNRRAIKVRQTEPFDCGCFRDQCRAAWCAGHHRG